MSWNYSNGLVANLGQIRYDELNHTITNLAYVDYREGLHKFSWSAGFSDFVRQAPREFAPAGATRSTRTTPSTPPTTTSAT